MMIEGTLSTDKAEASLVTGRALRMPSQAPEPEGPQLGLPAEATGTILDSIGNTPLVRLTRVAAGLRVPVLAKCEHMNPGGSVKDRIALAIIQEAESDGRLTPGATIVEATAGNTGLGLALVAAVKGYRLVCVLSEKMSSDKLDALTGLGVRVIVTPAVESGQPGHFKRVARELAAERGWLLANQFESPANPRVHEKTTAPELLAQSASLEGCAPAAFVAGAGTGGTISGVGRALRRAGAGTRIVLADPAGSVLGEYVRTGRPGEAGEHDLEGIGATDVPATLDREVVDAVLPVTDVESFAMARRLAREEGLFVGGSAGAAVLAALRVAADPTVSGPVVALLPDSWDRYRARDWSKLGSAQVERWRA